MNPRLARTLLVLLPLLCCSLLIFAQTEPATAQFLVKGKIVDAKTAKPMQGVTVKVKNSTQSTLTDDQGAFTIKVPSPESVLSISHIGYQVYETKAGDGGGLNISLTQVSTQLDEVVVVNVGYGTQKKPNVLGAVVTFNPKEIQDLPAANFSTGLKGMIAGVGISQTSGKPGATTTISIRNATTFASSQQATPLFVIDGIVPIISASGSVDASGKTAFDNLDPSQIESISFLKDAAATIYGARGANGVVLVTTKRGRPGKPRLSYSGSYSTEDAAKKPDMISGYDQAILLNNWVQNYKPGAPVAADVYTPAELDSIKARGDYNWFNAMWKPAYIQRHTLNVSGGSDKLTFFAGANYFNETGNLNNVTASKYGLRLGMTAKIIDGLTADMTIGIDNSNSNRPAPKGTTTSEQSDQLNATVGGLLSVPGWVPMYNNGLPVFYSPLGWHPDALNTSGSYSNDKAQSLAINASLVYQVKQIKGLSLRAQYLQRFQQTVLSVILLVRFCTQWGSYQ